MNTEPPALPRRVLIPLIAAFPVEELAAGAVPTAVGVAVVGDGGCADIFEMVSVAKEL